MKKELKTPENVAQEWLDLKNQRLLIEKRIDDLRPILEAFLDETDDKQAEMCGFNFKLIVSEREYFNLSKARKKIDGRVLNPYITVSTSNQIRATFKGDKEKEAA